MTESPTPDPNLQEEIDVGLLLLYLIVVPTCMVSRSIKQISALGLSPISLPNMTWTGQVLRGRSSSFLSLHLPSFPKVYLPVSTGARHGSSVRSLYIWQTISHFVRYLNGSD